MRCYWNIWQNHPPGGDISVLNSSQSHLCSQASWCGLSPAGPEGWTRQLWMPRGAWQVPCEECCHTSHVCPCCRTEAVDIKPKQDLSFIAYVFRENYTNLRFICNLPAHKVFHTAQNPDTTNPQCYHRVVSWVPLELDTIVTFKTAIIVLFYPPKA